MNLQPDECDQFYRIWWSLLSLCQQTDEVV